MYLKLHILPLDFLIKPVAQVLRPHLRQSRYLPGALPCDIRSEAAIRRSHQSENSSIASKVLNRVIPRCSSWLDGQLNTTRSLPGPKGTRYPTMAQNNCDSNHEKRWQSSGGQEILKEGTNGKTEKLNCPECLPSAKVGHIGTDGAAPGRSRPRKAPSRASSACPS